MGLGLVLLAPGPLAFAVREGIYEGIYSGSIILGARYAVHRNGSLWICQPAPRVTCHGIGVFAATLIATARRLGFGLSGTVRP